MPSIVYCGARLRMGTDDFVLPSGCSLLVRLLWYSLYHHLFDEFRIVMSLVILKTHTLMCSFGWLFDFYLGGALAVFVLQFVAELLTMFLSMQGKVLETRARQSVVTLLYLQTFLFLCEVAFSCIGV